MDLSIVIPVLNEALNIGQLLDRIENLVDSLQIRYEILVIDGGSVDQTQEIASQSRNVRVIQQNIPGYGSAIIEGISSARGEYIITMDADLSHDPIFLQKFWNERNDNAMMIGSRYVPGGRAEMSLVRLGLSRILNAFFRRGLSLKFRDLSSGFRLYRAANVKNLEFRSRGFDWLQEILILNYINGQKIIEIPIHYKPRHSGESHVKLIKFGIAYLKTFVRMWKLRNSIE